VEKSFDYGKANLLRKELARIYILSYKTRTPGFVALILLYLL
jgi:hypothetical protein